MPSPTQDTHAMAADAGDVLRPPPLLLPLLHWPMPPLALPPLKSHGGQGRGGCSCPRRAGGCRAHRHYHYSRSQKQTHNEVAPPAPRLYRRAVHGKTRSGSEVSFRQSSPASRQRPPACCLSFWPSLLPFCCGLNPGDADRSYHSKTAQRRRDYTVSIRAAASPSGRHAVS